VKQLPATLRIFVVLHVINVGGAEHRFSLVRREL
jgi:hypothetical protein